MKAQHKTPQWIAESQRPSAESSGSHAKSRPCATTSNNIKINNFYLAAVHSQQEIPQPTGQAQPHLYQVPLSASQAYNVQAQSRQKQQTQAQTTGGTLSRHKSNKSQNHARRKDSLVQGNSASLAHESQIQVPQSATQQLGTELSSEEGGYLTMGQKQPMTQALPFSGPPSSSQGYFSNQKRPKQSKVYGSPTQKDAETLWHESGAKDSMGSIFQPEAQVHASSLQRASSDLLKVPLEHSKAQSVHNKRQAYQTQTVSTKKQSTFGSHRPSQDHAKTSKGSSRAAAVVSNITAPQRASQRNEHASIASANQRSQDSVKYGMLSPKRAQATMAAKKIVGKNKSTSHSNLGLQMRSTTAQGSQSSKLAKVTSHKALVRLKAPASSQTRTKVGKTPMSTNNRAHSRTLYQEEDGSITATTIQAPMSNSTLMSASQSKFGANSRSQATQLIAQLNAAKSSLIQRQLSNKLLSPVATTSRKTVLGVTSPSKRTLDSAVRASQDSLSRAKATPGTVPRFSMPKGHHAPSHLKSRTGTAAPDATNIRSNSGGSSQIRRPGAHEGSLGHKAGPQRGTFKASPVAAHHAHTQSLQMAQKRGLLTNGSITSLLIKAPSPQASQATHLHKTNHSDKIPKLHLAERPKTTMFVTAHQQQQQQQQQQLQSQQSEQQNSVTTVTKYHQHAHLQKRPSRVYSPTLEQEQQKMLTQSTESLTTVAGLRKTQAVSALSNRPAANHQNAQRSSGDFTLQTYRLTSQSSQGGLINHVRGQSGFKTQQTIFASTESRVNQPHPSASSQFSHHVQPFRANSQMSQMAMSQPRFSTSAKTTKSAKKAPKSISVAETAPVAASVPNQFPPQLSQRPNVAFSHRRSSKQQSNMREEEALALSDDGVSSNRSGQTHVIDEVLHQQKTEAYLDLQRKAATANAESSHMGRIIEQDDELHDVSVEKCEIPQELETEVQEQLEFAKPSTASRQASAANLTNAKVNSVNYVTTQQHRTGGASNLRVFQPHAKTTVNLQDLRGISQGVESCLSQRKKSNDTIVQARYGDTPHHQRKGSLAMLLQPGKAGAPVPGKETGSSKAKGKPANSTTVVARQPEEPARGLISESLVNSYLTGTGSLAGQSHKWMCSSKSAKNMMTSCSLGPKSELRQTEQANAENMIKITPGTFSPALEKAPTVPKQQPEPKSVKAESINQSHQETVLTDQQGHTPRPGDNQMSPGGPSVGNEATRVAFGPKKAKLEGQKANQPRQSVTDASLLKPPLESFKSTLVDYTESMNENQITRLTLEQSREMLLKACRIGDLRAVRRLSLVKQMSGLDQDIVNVRSKTDPKGNAPLHLACINGHVDMAELLIRKMNANIAFENNLGETALHLACAEGHKGIIERLLLARVPVNLQDRSKGNTALHVLALANHARQQATTVVSDTVRQTMESCVHPTSKQFKSEISMAPDFDDHEQLVTEDFAVADSSGQAIPRLRCSLIELILPFAEESKQIRNKDGQLPWQLAQSDQVANLLKPTPSGQGQSREALEESKTGQKSLRAAAPVTASQVQGQKDQGKNSMVTRNHGSQHMLSPKSTNNNPKEVEIKQVSESEIANIFTFFKATKPGEQSLVKKYAGTSQSREEKQFTFQATQTQLSDNKAEAPDLIRYQTTSSAKMSNKTAAAQTGKASAKQQQIGKALRRLEEEQTKRRCQQDFLDEDIERIDKLAQQATSDSNEYAAACEPPSESSLQNQFLKRIQQLEDTEGPDRQLQMSDSQRALSVSSQTKSKRVDTPARSTSATRHTGLAAPRKTGPSNKYQQVTHRGPFPGPHQAKQISQQVAPGKGIASHYSPQKKLTVKSGTAKTNKTVASTKLAHLSGVNNQTQDSSQKSTAPVKTISVKPTTSSGSATGQGARLSKVRTEQNLRPLTSTQQSQKVKVPEASGQLDTLSGSKTTTALKSTSRQNPLPSKGAAAAMLTKIQKQAAGSASALDLKQKVDKQAGLLVEAMQQRASTRQAQQPTPTAQVEKRYGPDEFVAHQLLGTGSFGEVFLVERKADKKLLAMKVLSKKKIKQQNLKKYAITERNVMCSMGEHPFIVQLRYAFQTRDHLFLISDYCPGGDLSQYLEIEGRFSEEKARLYISEILLGIEALHKHNIIFRDLKPDNVIIDKKGHAMLTDFGLSRENVRRGEIGAKSFCGSYAYLAPEMLKKNGHGKAVDWYLLGVILFEMVTGLPPYYADDKDQLFKNIVRDTIDMRKVKGEQNLSSECIDLMTKLLEKDPARRIGTRKGGQEIRQHPFFRAIDWDSVFHRRLEMPEPYLANMAMEIIRSQPYLVAGHPHTVGEVCPREHRSYLQGWSFVQPNQVMSESMLSDSEKLIALTAEEEQKLQSDREGHHQSDIHLK